jgi:hypothetical protein
MVLTSGSNESISTMLKSLAFVFFVALRGMPACFGPTGAGNRRAGKKGDTVESCHRGPVVAPPGRTGRVQLMVTPASGRREPPDDATQSQGGRTGGSRPPLAGTTCYLATSEIEPCRRTLLRKSQKTRVAILIVDGAPIFRWLGFFQAAVCRGLSRCTVRLTSGSQQSKSILDEDPRKKSRAKWHNKASKKAATYCQPLPFFVRWEHSLKRLKPKHGLALGLCTPRSLPCTSGIALIPSRTQHRLASAEPGGTWLSRLCGTAQEEGTVRVG